MVTHPIYVPRQNYRGSNSKKSAKVNRRNLIAMELEQLINRKLQEQKLPIEQYLYYELAAETGYSESEIHDVCYGIDGGSNGFTAIRKDLSYEEAMDIMQGRKPDPWSE